MATKSRKSLSSLWCSCEHCGTVISQKDSQSHNESDCPPPESDWRHPYIKNITLYSKIEIIKGNCILIQLIQKYKLILFMMCSGALGKMCSYVIYVLDINLCTDDLFLIDLSFAEVTT